MINSGVREELKKRKIEVLQRGIMAKPETIQIEISSTEDRVDEIKKVVSDVQRKII